ncbi:hypothetical protein C8R45DRAFT_941628 [Mycena sanguinolenta]|nr:hypothetical protein C8R45DRAFT_941628 [Mycena sanguinolenta]
MKLYALTFLCFPGPSIDTLLFIPALAQHHIHDSVVKFVFHCLTREDSRNPQRFPVALALKCQIPLSSSHYWAGVRLDWRLDNVPLSILGGKKNARASSAVGLPLEPDRSWTLLSGARVSSPHLPGPSDTPHSLGHIFRIASIVPLRSFSMRNSNTLLDVRLWLVNVASLRMKTRSSNKGASRAKHNPEFRALRIPGSPGRLRGVTVTRSAPNFHHIARRDSCLLAGASHAQLPPCLLHTPLRTQLRKAGYLALLRSLFGPQLAEFVSNGIFLAGWLSFFDVWPLVYKCLVGNSSHCPLFSLSSQCPRDLRQAASHVPHPITVVESSDTYNDGVKELACIFSSGTNRVYSGAVNLATSGPRFHIVNF